MIARIYGLLVCLFFLTSLQLQAAEKADYKRRVQPAPPKLIFVGTGGVNGLYYPTGGALCRLFDKIQADDGFHCIVESTAGSQDNIKRLAAGQIDMGIVQSDIQYRSYHGSLDINNPAPVTKLRALFSLHPEPFTVLARKDANITTFYDLKGKRVNFGNLGSGQRATMTQLVKNMGWTEDDFMLISDLVSVEQAHALCNNKVDAIIFVAGHPNISIREAANTCDTNLVSVTGKEIDKLVSQHRYFRKAIIPGGLYHGNASDIATFGVGATFVTTVDTPDEIAYLMVKAVFEQLEHVRKLHPAFSRLTKKGMIREGLTAPLHPGALRYYQEAGLIE